MNTKTLLPLTLAISTQVASANESPLEEVVITSSRVEMPMRHIGTSISVLDAEDIQLRGQTALADVLRTQTAVAVSNSGGKGKASALRIRGEEGYRTLVRIDGVEVSDPTGTQVGPQIQHLLSAGVARVEILRGPQGMMYGADAGGVINITTGLKSEGFGGGLSVESGRYGTQQYNGFISAGDESGDIYLSYVDLNSDGFNTLKADQALGDNDGYENKTLHLKGSYKLSEELELSAVIRDRDSLSEYDSSFGSSDRETNSDQQTYRVALAYDSGNFRHELSASKTDVYRENFTAGISAFLTEGEIRKLEYLGSSEINDQHALVYGLEQEQEDIISSSGDRAKRDQLGYFLELQSKITKDLFVTAGMRLDDNDDFGRHTSYRLSAAYVVDLGAGSNIKYRASYGTGFRAPSLSEIAYNAGPAAFPPASLSELTEETSKGYEFGIEYFGSEGLYLEAVYFDQELTDELYFDLIGFSGYLQAEGRGQSTGVELSVEQAFASGLWLSANYTYNETESPGGLSRSRRPEHLANLALSYDILPDRWSVIVNYRITKDAVNEIFGLGFVELDDYEVLDLSTNYNLTEQASVYLRVENASNEDYEEVTGYQTAGSSLYVGARYSF